MRTNRHLRRGDGSLSVPRNACLVRSSPVRRGHSAPRGNTTPCPRILATIALGDGERAPRSVVPAREGDGGYMCKEARGRDPRTREAPNRLQGVRGSASASTGGEPSARSAGLEICEHGRSEADARSAKALRSASTGGASRCKECGVLRSATREAAILLQGVRGLEHLRAREAAKRVQAGGAGASASTGGTELRKECGALRSASTGGGETSARSAGARASEDGRRRAGVRSAAALRGSAPRR